ncbi:MAG: carboxypeptidase regulatory-like domain-containing protein [Planctomycetota bacterium]
MSSHPGAAAVLFLLVTSCASYLPEMDWKPFPGRLPGEHVRDLSGRTFLWAGQIVDEETLAPIEGARVRVFSESGTIVIDGRSTLLGQGMSDANGFVEVTMALDPCPSHWLVVADGYAPRTATRHWRWWPHEPALLEESPVLELSRGRPFRGRVVDPLGRPMPGVRISLYDGCRHAPAQQRGVTDEHGRFAFGRSDHSRVWIEGGGVAARDAEWFRDIDGGALVVAEPGVTVEGRVLSPEGRPLPDIWVRVWERGPATRTGADGRFRLEGADPSWVLGLATDHAPAKHGVVVKTDQAAVVRDPKPLILGFDPRTGDAGDRLDSVRVTVRPGAGAEGAVVTIVSEECGHSDDVVVEDGIAVLRVPRGPCEIRVGGALDRVWWRPFSMDLLSDGEIELPDPPPVVERPLLRLRLPGLKLRGAMFGAWVTLWTGDGDFRHLENLAEPIPVPAGVPMALHVKPASGPLTIVPLAVPADAKGVIERTVRRDTPADGSFVLHETGTPEVWFRCAPVGEFRRGFAAYRGGWFEFSCPLGATGEMYVEVAEEERGAVVDIEPGRIDPVDVELRGERDIEVVVRGRDGRAVPGLTVRVSMAAAEGFYDQWAVTDASGRARFRRRQPVDRVCVWGEGVWIHGFPVTVGEAIHLVVPTSTVTLLVPSGPLPRAWLQGREMAPSEDVRGRTLRCVPPGRHVLVVAFPDGRRWTKEIVVRSGEDERIELEPATPVEPEDEEQKAEEK